MPYTVSLIVTCFVLTIMAISMLIFLIFIIILIIRVFFGDMIERRTRIIRLKNQRNKD
jgi:hypothetical protein